MDIKDLNKPQLILLALLISFVTSLATGITTVTLMQQAPDTVTTPITNVVRQTVEKIVQVPGKTAVQTVVIKEEDLVVDAIEKNKSALFSLTKEWKDNDGNAMQASAGYGFAVSEDGILVADSFLISPEENYYAENESGKFKATPIASQGKKDFVFLKIGEPLDPASKISFSVPEAGDIGQMKAGQKILILGESVSSLFLSGSKELKIPGASGGSLVLNLEGQALGMVSSAGEVKFVPIDKILESLI